MRPRDPRRWRGRSRALPPGPPEGLPRPSPALRRLPGAPWEATPAGVVSRQRAELAGVERLWPAAELGRLYWADVERLFRGLVRAEERDGRVELVVLRRPLVLLSFDRVVLEDDPDRTAATFPIASGLLVAPDGRHAGHLRLSAQTGPGGALTLCSEVAGFRPSLAGWGRLAGRLGWLYAQTQLRIHLLVTWSWMGALADWRGGAR